MLEIDRPSRFVTLLGCLLLFIPATAASEPQIPSHIVDMAVIEGMFKTMTIATWEPEEDRLVFFYGDRTNVVRQVEFKDGAFTRLWKSYPLGGTVREIFVEDLDADGVNEVITYTAAGEINVWQEAERRGFSVRWESVNEGFTTLEALAVANADHDDALELILCADKRLIIYDGVEFIRQKEGRDEFHPYRILVGNVDGDPEDELILSDGHIVNMTTLRIEWSTEPFGDPIYLYDFNGDGAMEIVGQQAGAIQAWEISRRRVIW